MASLIFSLHIHSPCFSSYSSTTNLSATCPFLDTLGLPGKCLKAALGVGDTEAAQEVGGDIENLHADLAIDGNVFAVAVAKP